MDKRLVELSETIVALAEQDDLPEDEGLLFFAFDKEEATATIHGRTVILIKLLVKGLDRLLDENPDMLKVFNHYMVPFVGRLAELTLKEREG